MALGKVSSVAERWHLVGAPGLSLEMLMAFQQQQFERLGEATEHGSGNIDGELSAPAPSKHNPRVL